MTIHSWERPYKFWNMKKIAEIHLMLGFKESYQDSAIRSMGYFIPQATVILLSCLSCLWAPKMSLSHGQGYGKDMRRQRAGIQH